ADKLPDFLKRISIFGDLRMRHEGFYHQPARDGTVVTARNRERFRARVGIKATFSDELSTTVRIASGNPDDPISTNETADREFTPKHVNLDWAFLTFTPGTTFGIRPGLITTNLGKFPNPIYRPGEMVFDDDISFEGASQTLSVLSQPYGLLDALKVH